MYVFQLRARLCVLLLEFSLPSFLYGCVRHFQLIVCKLLRVVRRGEDTVRVESSQRNLLPSACEYFEGEKDKEDKEEEKQTRFVPELSPLPRRAAFASRVVRALLFDRLGTRLNSTLSVCPLHLLFVCANRKRRGLIIKYA